MKEQPLADYRKYHYWRGFRAGMLAMLPFVLALMWAVDTLLNAVVK